jgi:imidazolonepropionase-like amidohydrolase
MTALVLRNLKLLEPEFGEARPGYELLIEGGIVREVSEAPIVSRNAEILDCGGRVVMPGLIDSHVHVMLSDVVIPNLEKVPLTLATGRAAALMLGMLNRGFTTVRDTGGAGRSGRRWGRWRGRR